MIINNFHLVENAVLFYLFGYGSRGSCQLVFPSPWYLFAKSFSSACSYLGSSEEMETLGIVPNQILETLNLIK